MQLRHRHVQLVALGVFDGEKFAVAAANIEFEQALIAADTMIDMHDGRADRQFRQIADDGFRIACGALAASALLRAFAQQFVFGEQAQGWLVQGKALLQCGHGDGKARSCLRRGRNPATSPPSQASCRLRQSARSALRGDRPTRWRSKRGPDSWRQSGRVRLRVLRPCG
jgi:hypothetical protein